MKKFILIFIFTIFITSCINHDYRPINSNGTYVTDIEYNGHKYLEFRERGQYGFSMVHDPECECFTNIKENSYDSEYN